MKKTLFIGLAFLIACANQAGNGETAAVASSNSGSGVMSNVKVSTTSNGTLGYSIQADVNKIRVITTTKWIASITYEGADDPGSQVYFASAGCTGAAYTPGTSMYGKSLIYDGANLWKPTTINANGVATASSVAYASYRLGGGCTNASNTTNLIPVSAATRTDAGLPTTITPPIVFETP